MVGQLAHARLGVRGPHGALRVERIKHSHPHCGTPSQRSQRSERSQRTLSQTCADKAAPMTSKEENRCLKRTFWRQRSALPVRRVVPNTLHIGPERFP